MATADARKQDMPPPGGYRPINYKRVAPRTYFNGFALIGGFLGVSAGAFYLYYLNCIQVHKEDIEKRSARFAVYPMILAERDREYLKQLRRNRDEEADLMANVKGWEVGTYYGEPLYRTVPEDTLHNPQMLGYYVHANIKDYKRRAHMSLWS